MEEREGLQVIELHHIKKLVSYIKGLYHEIKNRDYKEAINYFESTFKANEDHGLYSHRIREAALKRAIQARLMINKSQDIYKEKIMIS